MPASITGIVFDDVNGNGIYDGGEPGIPDAYVVLENPNGVCTNVQSDGTGNYSFVNLTIAGDYTIYETVANPFITCPPTNFTQPAGFNMSTTPRAIMLTITALDIANNVVFSDQNFGHQNITTWGCDPDGLQIAGNPANAFSLNLVTGNAMNLGSLTPQGRYNAVGYSELDNTIWGSDQNIAGNVFRLNPDLTVNSYSIPNLLGGFNTGDVDLNGHLYLYSTGNPFIFYVVDVDPNSPTFLQLVDPTNGFVLDTAPFGTPIVSVAALDWAFNPVDNQLYAATIPGGVVRIDPLTGVVTPLIASGLPPSSYGAQFFDSTGAMYVLDNLNGNIYRITFSGGTNADAVLFSSSVAAALNDGARCASALLNLVEVTKSVDPTSTCPGGTLTFISVIENVGALLDATNVVFTDNLPAGITFVPGSVLIDGVPMPAEDPTTGINVGDISPTDSITVTFQVIVDTFPVPTFPIVNTSRISGDNTAEVLSNEVSVTQAMTDLEVEKSATPTLIEIGDVIIYTITVTNEGPNDIQNITLIDLEPTGTNFIPNSVTIDGILRPGEDPNAGILLKNLEVGESTTIRFRVMTVSGDRFITNTAEVRYCLDQVIESNQVITLICGNKTIC